MTFGSDDNLKTLVIRLAWILNTQPLREAMQCIQQNPQLLSAEAESVAHHVATVHPDEDKRRQFQLTEETIQRCRKIGVDAAFLALALELGAIDLRNPSVVEQTVMQLQDPAQLQQRIVFCGHAVATVERAENPVLWAFLHYQLALSYLENPSDNIEADENLAIDHFQKALEEIDAQAFPEAWAATQNGLAMAFCDLTSGEKAANVERALNLLQVVLRAITIQDHPDYWAMTQANLGSVFGRRIAGSRAENLESSILHLVQALDTYTRKDYPSEWATVCNNLGNAYRERMMGDQSDNIERSIFYYHQALEVFTRQHSPSSWAMTQANLGNSYSDRRLGNREQNFQKAVEALENALTIRTRGGDPLGWATTMMSLAAVYSDYGLPEADESIDKAIDIYNQVLAVYSRDDLPFEWATVMYNLGNAYYQRSRGSREQNIEKAIDYFHQSLTVRTQEVLPADWALVQNSLATAYRNRIAGTASENHDVAADLYRQTLAVYTLTEYPTRHLAIQRNLGFLYLNTKKWSAAVHAFRSAMEASELLYTTATTPEARLAQLSEIRGVPASLAYALMMKEEREMGDLADIVSIFEKSQARWLTESLSLNQNKPTEIPDAVWERFEAAAENITRLQAEARLPDGTPGKHDYVDLAERIETARDELSVAVGDLRMFWPEFMSQPSYSNIENLFQDRHQGNTESHVGVYLFCAPQGGAAILVHRSGIDVVPLNELTADTADALINDWVNDYRTFLRTRKQSDRQAWFETLDVVTHQLWDLVVSPIILALETLGYNACQDHKATVITIFPNSLLRLLPLHLAWTDDPAKSGSRKYFIDAYAVRYAPSATVLLHCKERAKVSGKETLLAVDEPVPTRGRKLPSSGREVSAISSYFVEPKILRHESATRMAVLEEMTTAQVMHFACHGSDAREDPLESGLLMANDEWLTVRDVLGSRPAMARLAVLSACETGVIGTQVPDEVIMLPSAMVHAGFGGVVASLWSVADTGTAMLMVRFYHAWRTEGLEPVFAIRAAQQWVRDTTSQEKADFFGQFMSGMAGRMAGDIAAEFFTAALLQEDGPDARTFEHPFWWGAFYLTGV